jgi:hypothetical protein
LSGAGGGGSLTLVGTGIRLAHLAPDARSALERAETVFFLVADALTRTWLERLRPDAGTLAGFYADGKPRRDTYAEMAEHLLEHVRGGAHVCAAFYGHPGVLVRPAHLAVAAARREGYPARMLPAISALDCLLADLAIDPGDGCQSYEATGFLVTGRVPDPEATLVLWQLGPLGETAHRPEVDTSRLPVLVDDLRRFYPPEHETIVYEASPYPVCDPTVQLLPLGELAGARISFVSTLVVPPVRAPQVDAALAAALRLE